MSTVLAAGLAVGVAGPAAAGPPSAGASSVGLPAGASPGGLRVAGGAAVLPPGWQLGPDDAHRPTLTWLAPQPVPMGDAIVAFYAGNRLLGRPRPAADGRTFRLAAPHLGPAELAGLQARAGGRRLDVVGLDAARRADRAARPPVAPAPAPAPANPVDPGVPGPYRTIQGKYTLASVRLPGLPQPVEMQGVVVAPRDAPGPRPLVMLLHGRHSVCYGGPAPGVVAWPCPAGTRPVPSYRGYLQAQELLASQGYLTVSIAANGINAQDDALADGGAQARSSLVRLHLARWADWAGAGRGTAPAVVRAAPRADLSRVLLMGHSRGGEGVNRAATDSLTPPPAAQDGYPGPVRWTIRGTVLFGPTLFGHNPAPDVPSTTILPGCDGDVADLQGQQYLDATVGVSRGTALHSAVYVVGANHNFFNTEWTPGQAVAPAVDDFYDLPSTPDPVCSPDAATRLTATQQQTVGATYLAASARLFLAGDDRVRPLLDGTPVRAPSADPARVLSHAVGGARTPVVVPQAGVTVAGTGARRCVEVTEDPAEQCLARGGPDYSPHFVSFDGYPDPDRSAVLLDWSAPGQPVTVRPARPGSAAGARELALRIVVPPNTAESRFAVAVTDVRGRRADLGEVGLAGLPGSARTSADWAQEVRVPLPDGGVDLAHLASLELVPRTGSGRAWLIDAWGWRPGTPVTRPAALARLDVGELTVGEGDLGVRTYRATVRVSGRGSGQVRLFRIAPHSAEVTSRLVTVPRGVHRIEVPVRVPGDTRYGSDDVYGVAVQAAHGSVVGGYLGGVVARDDDPLPVITVTPAAAQAVEGTALTWRVTSSAPTEEGLFMDLVALPPADAPELSSTDVDPDWFFAEVFTDPLPSRPLSEAGLEVFVNLLPTELTADVSVPTIVDEVAEPAEQLRLRTEVIPADFGPPIEGAVVTGTVVDQP